MRFSVCLNSGGLGDVLLQLRYLYSLGTALGLDFSYRPNSFTEAAGARTPKAVIDRLNIEEELTNKYPHADDNGRTAKLTFGAPELDDLEKGLSAFAEQRLNRDDYDTIELSWQNCGDQKINRADLYNQINKTCEDKAPFVLSPKEPSELSLFSKSTSTRKAIVHFRSSDIASIQLPFGKSISFRQKWPRPILENTKIDPIVDPDAIIPIVSELKKHYHPLEVVCYSSGYRAVADNIDWVAPLLPEWLSIEDFLRFSKLQAERFRRICELADVPYLEGEGVEETVAFIEDALRADIVVTTWGSLAFSVMDFSNTHGRLWARVGMRQETLHRIGLKSSRLQSIGLTEANLADLAQAKVSR